MKKVYTNGEKIAYFEKLAKYYKEWINTDNLYYKDVLYFKRQLENCNKRLEALMKLDPGAKQEPQDWSERVSEQIKKA